MLRTVSTSRPLFNVKESKPVKVVEEFAKHVGVHYDMDFVQTMDAWATTTFLPYKNARTLGCLVDSTIRKRKRGCFGNQSIA